MRGERIPLHCSQHYNLFPSLRGQEVVHVRQLIERFPMFQGDRDGSRLKSRCRE